MLSTNLRLKFPLSTKAQHRQLPKTKQTKALVPVLPDCETTFRIPKSTYCSKTDLLKCGKSKAKPFGKNYLLNRARKASGLKDRLHLPNLKLQLLQKLDRSKRENLQHMKRVMAQIEKQTRRNLGKAIGGGGKQHSGQRTDPKKILSGAIGPKSNLTCDTSKNFFFVRKSSDFKKNFVYRRKQRVRGGAGNRSPNVKEVRGKLKGAKSCGTEQQSNKGAGQQTKQSNLVVSKCEVGISDFERKLQQEWSQSPLVPKSEPNVEMDSETLLTSAPSSDQPGKPSLQKRNRDPFNESGTFGLNFLFSDEESTVPLSTPSNAGSQNILQPNPKLVSTSDHPDLQHSRSFRSRNQTFDASNRNQEGLSPNHWTQATFVCPIQTRFKLHCHWEKGRSEYVGEMGDLKTKSMCHLD